MLILINADFVLNKLHSIRMYGFKLEGGGGELFKDGFRKLFSLE